MPFRLSRRNVLLDGLFALLICGANAFTAHAQEKPIAVANSDLPLSRYQCIGSHNSYHIAPSEKIRQLIEMFAEGQGAALDYSHPPLAEQLDLGVRQIELDLYGDPQGGLYANPLSARFEGEKAAPLDPAWKTPGFKIFHSPDFDTKTTVITLRLALKQLLAWSGAHPKHEPVMVLLELETETFTATKPPVFDEKALLALEGEIREELPASKILAPDEVRGDFPTLREAVTRRGWPTLDQTRGKFIFALDNEDSTRERYLSLSPNKDLKGRVCFVSVPEAHPAAAWMKRNDAIGSFEEIRSLVKAGFMVRTRADVDLKEVIANDRTRLEAALNSGAQWISTDAFKIDPRYPNYQVWWAGHAPLRLNPVH